MADFMNPYPGLFGRFGALVGMNNPAAQMPPMPPGADPMSAFRASEAANLMQDPASVVRPSELSNAQAQQQAAQGGASPDMSSALAKLLMGGALQSPGAPMMPMPMGR